MRQAGTKGVPGIGHCLKERALEDSNPRHRVLETRVLPTELRTPEKR